ncbi:hypothetical protein PS627_00994 [Pseudomonas fluorescens]|uniref:pilus assembly protein PilP n=1 Tax=Pseudomonas fluorescens TaxID=294 RepID=UPI0012557DD4|nr:pilus assembly protein PilP [Pseudomonas fluorescens]CAG8864366.1 hypothetical protein PS627_00994 [Pseudomonas fluorescens]VVP73146.1 hypothetical protein PS910_01207 [Pseudomonas fluorescens]
MSFSLHPDWQGLAERSTLFKAALLALVILGVLGLGYCVRLDALRVELDIAAGHARDLHAQRMGKDQQARRFTELQAALECSRQQLQDTRWRLAAGGDMAELLEDLSRLGREHGLLFEQVDALESSDGAGYRTVPLTLQMVGRYPALRLWLDQWLGQLRLLRVQHLRIGAVDGETGRLRMHMAVNAYHADQQGLGIPRSLAAEAARGEGRLPVIDPFRRKTGQVIANSLASVPLEQLEMVGSLARHGEHQALLRLAGAVHRVRVGDPVGGAGGRVSRIDEQQVEVLEPGFVEGQGWLEQARYLVLRKRTVMEVTDELEGHGDDGVAGNLADAGNDGDTGHSG